MERLVGHLVLAALEREVTAARPRMQELEREERISAAAAVKSDLTEDSRLRLAEVDKALKAPEGSEAGPPDSSAL